MSTSAAELVDRAVAAGVMPGAVLAAGLRSADPLLLHVAGDAQRDMAARRPMTADTVFDLASLTKVVATTPCLLWLAAGARSAWTSRCAVTCPRSPETARTW